jgi:hypothetical protein
MEDAQKDPKVVIAYLMGRELRSADLYAAFGLSRSGYRKARQEGRLLTADNLMRVAEHFGLNPIELLMRFGLVAPEAVSEFVESGPYFERTTPRREVAARRATRFPDAEALPDVPTI